MAKAQEIPRPHDDPKKEHLRSAARKYKVGNLSMTKKAEKSLVIYVHFFFCNFKF